MKLQHCSSSKKRFSQCVELFVIGAAFIFTQQDAHARTKLQAKMLCLLGKFAYQADEHRTPVAADFFSVFKNVPGFREWFLKIKGARALRQADLDNSNIMIQLFNEFKASERPHSKSRILDLTQSNPGSKHYQPARAHKDPTLRKARDPRHQHSQANYEADPMQQYEVEVLMLAQGDQVRVIGQDGKKRTIILGAFLGAGNSNHVYREQTHPDRVIRIPFVPGFRIFERDPHSSFVMPRNPIEYARDHILSDMRFEKGVRTAVESAAKQCKEKGFPELRMVKVYGYGKGNEFAEMEFVRMEYKATEWIEKVEKVLKLNLLEFFDHPDPSLAVSLKRLSPSDAKKMQSLVLLTQAILKNNQWTPQNLKSFPKNAQDSKRSLYMAVLRNAIWDGKTWVVNDWEALPSSVDEWISITTSSNRP